MKVFNNSMAPLSPSIVFLAISKAESGNIEKARAHPAQVAMWLQNCLTVGAITLKSDELPSFKEFKHKVTIGGVPLEEDSTMNPHRVDFVNKEGEVLSRIEALPVPTIFMEESR